MEPQTESKIPFLKQSLIKELAVVFLSIVGIVLTLLVTRGSQFCILTIGSCVSRSGHSGGAELLYDRSWCSGSRCFSGCS